MEKIEKFGMVFVIISPMLAIVSVFLGYSLGESTLLFSSVFIVGLVLLFREKLSELSLGSLRLKLKEKITEAEEVLQKLKSFSKVSAEASYTSLISSGRMGSVCKNYLNDFESKLDSELKALPLSAQEIDSAKKYFNRIKCFDIGCKIRQNIKSIIRQKLDKNKLDSELNKLSDLSEIRSFDKFDDIDKTLYYLQVSTFLTEEDKQKIRSDNEQLINYHDLISNPYPKYDFNEIDLKSYWTRNYQ